MRKRYFIQNKRRFMIITAITISIISSTLFLVTKAPKGYTEAKYDEITVVYGDTLWDIAMEISGQNIDVRKTIADIKKANGLITSELYVGQILTIPLN